MASTHDLVIRKHSQGLSGSVGNLVLRPRDLANVNEWKIMFDPSNNIYDEYSNMQLSIYYNERI